MVSDNGDRAYFSEKNNSFWALTTDMSKHHVYLGMSKKEENIMFILGCQSKVENRSVFLHIHKSGPSLVCCGVLHNHQASAEKEDCKVALIWFDLVRHWWEWSVSLLRDSLGCLLCKTFSGNLFYTEPLGVTKQNKSFNLNIGLYNSTSVKLPVHIPSSF